MCCQEVLCSLHVGIKNVSLKQHSEERVKTDEACLFLKEMIEPKHKMRVGLKMNSALDLNNPEVMEEVLKQVTNRTTMSMLL